MVEAMGLDKLVEYEKEFDSVVQGLPLWQLPVRPILTALHYIADSLFNGSQLDDSYSPQPEVGCAAGERLSYLIPSLLKCTSEPMDLDAADALGAFHKKDPHGVGLRLLLEYGHFCQLMPEVHHGYYAIEGDVSGGFSLSHANPQFTQHEALDILLSELSMSFVSAPPPHLADRFDYQARLAPRLDYVLKVHTLKLFYDHYCQHLIEPPILTEEGYRVAMGVGREEFGRFCAALCTYADYCKGMAYACKRRLQREGFSEAVRDELFEWISVNWKETFFVGTLQWLTGLGFDKIDHLLAFFTIDFRDGHKSGKHAGDGFLPPLARFEQAYLFNPDLLKLFLPARNVLYTLNRTDQKRFDQLVSQHLEPQLLEATGDLFRLFDGLDIVPNHYWISGEMDLLVYSAAENVVLHVQAKASIPPHGARMVQTVEGRMQEGIKQLERLRGLAPEQRNAVLSQALGKAVYDVMIIDVLLSRSCLGTDRIWSQLGDILPLNLTLLRGVLRQARSEGPGLSLRSFPARVREETRRLIQTMRPQYVQEELRVGRTMLRVPLLKFDSERLGEERRQIWASS